MKEESISTEELAVIAMAIYAYETMAGKRSSSLTRSKFEDEFALFEEERLKRKRKINIIIELLR